MENYQYKYDYQDDILLKSVNGHKWFYFMDKTEEPIYNDYEKYLLDCERKLYEEAQEAWTQAEIELQNDPDYWKYQLQMYQDSMTDEEIEIVTDLAVVKNEIINPPKTKKGIKDNLVVIDSPDKYFSIGKNGRNFEPVLLSTEIDYRYLSTFYDGQIYYYYENGVYKPNAERKIRHLSQELLGNESRKSRIEEVIYWLKNQNIIDDISKINPNDGYINVKNGLLNWKTGELIEHDEERVSTIQFNVEYDPNANDPIIKNFINNVLDKDTHKTLFEMIGYFLIPIVEYEKIFLFTGTGSNGKSKLMLTILEMLGDGNVSNVKIQDLEGERSRFKIAELQNKVLNAFTDISSDALKTTGNLKAIASGESFNAERKGKDPFNFKPFAKLLFSANDLPKSYDNTDAFFRRITVFPFTRKFTDENKDTKMLEKLTTPSALSTLLNYALEGLRRLEKQGTFTYSKVIDNQVKDYQNESDIIMKFCNEFYIKSENEKDRVPCSNTYQNYRVWCHDNGLQPFSSINFNKHIQQKLNLPKEKKKVNGVTQMCWIGLKTY
ncbi:phage/plasmid primase, P4 family [Neobacillus sp. PS3-40]|uniref:DNA primase family protein n=1 Tax=Neobacillus sp. PS3-40 TaxID=3070679 RepID=UPI0027E078E8|nr:phage/plasmid primase, P4 family [Neobacillus sp. PS3-40]WML44065.1 phage/plasmid primase, P4 family [Neobacillus sp. PS3-40]